MARKQTSKGAEFLSSIRQDKRKLLMIGGAALVVIIFIIFLSSLGSDEDKAAPAPAGAAQTGHAGSLSSQIPQVPASQRYDYSNMLEGELPSPAQATSDLQGSVTAGQDDPFAGMRPQTPEQEQTEAAASAPESYQAQTAPAQDTMSQDAPSGQLGHLKAYLYCGSYGTEPLAQEQKALLAFQGLGSQVVRSPEGNFQLKIGPFDNREQARAKFNELGTQGLVERCALVDE